MSIRSLLPIAVVIAAAATAGPASAQSPTDNPVPGVQPGACTDLVKPTSSFTRAAARSAGKKRLLRGVAADTGCGVDRVAISVQRKRGSKCQTLYGKGRLLRKQACGKKHWLLTSGTTNWSFRLSKKLPKGKYVVRTRAIDFAGNVQQPRTGRLRLR
jgi:hypothetical protein